MEALILVWISSLLTIILISGIYLRREGSDYGQELRVYLTFYRPTILMISPCTHPPSVKVMRELIRRGFVVVLNYKQVKSPSNAITIKELKREFRILSFMNYLVLWRFNDV